MWCKEDLEELKQARDQILDAAENIKNLIRINGTRHDLDAAKAYWLGHIMASAGHYDYVERNNMLEFMKELGYNEDTEQFESEDDEDGEDEEEETDDEQE